jgi:hypothetical protein
MMSDVNDITRCMENRLAAFEVAQKLEKLESFQLAKPSDLRDLGSFAQLKQPAEFAGITAMEAGRKAIGRRFRKKIQLINKFRWKEDSKTSSFATLYQPLI